MDISITTRSAILRKVKRLNFESLSDIERRCFPKISRVMAPYGHFLAKCTVWINLFYCEVISFDNVAYVVTHWHTVKHYLTIQGYISLRSSSCEVHCAVWLILHEIASSTIITHIDKIHVNTALYGALWTPSSLIDRHMHYGVTVRYTVHFSKFLSCSPGEGMFTYKSCLGALAVLCLFKARRRKITRSDCQKMLP